MNDTEYDELVAARVFSPIPAVYVRVLEEWRSTSASNMSDWSVVATQHVQGSFIALVRALLEIGIAPGRFHVIPKAYSSVPAVVSWLEDSGISLHHVAFRDICRSYERSAAVTVSEVADRVLQEARGPVLLVDEGGRLTREFARRARSSGVHIAAVEQTTRGIHLTRKIRPNFSVVDVASSQPKRNVESRYVAHSMVAGIERAIRLLDRESLAESRVVLMGCGAVGLAIAMALTERSASLRVVDVDSVRRTKAKKYGLEAVAKVTPRDLANTLVLSSTGRRSVSRAFIENLMGNEVFLNCGSSDIEFPAAMWRCRDGLAIGADAPWETNYARRSLVGGYSTLVSGGFPVNFGGQFDTIPEPKFRLTRALMLAGMLQAVTSKEPGMTPLSPQLIDLVVDSGGSESE